jgi:hypothetical protein
MIRSETSVAHPLTLAGRAATNRVSASLIPSGRQVEAATPECYSRSKKRIAAAPASATLTYHQPIVDLRAFTNRNFTLGAFYTFVVGTGMYGTTYLVPLFLAPLKELDHKLQSLHLAHFVVGGWSSTKWIVPPRHVISHQRFVKQQSVLNLSLGFRYPCGPSWMNGRRRARVLPAPFPSDVFLTRVN